MKCARCGTGVMQSPLHRVNPTGQAGIWWCENCLKAHEPELLDNALEDGGKVLQDLKQICYGKQKKG